MSMSLYETLGRDAGIRVAVDNFYDRVLADARLAPYFAGTDLRRLRSHQASFLVQATGGPVAYEGRVLAAAHERLGITGSDFDRVVGHLTDTLLGLGVPPEPVGQVVAAVAAHRGDVVTGPAAAG